jgi:hypothetical protein
MSSSIKTESSRFIHGFFLSIVVVVRAWPKARGRGQHRRSRGGGNTVRSVNKIFVWMIVGK